MSWGTRRRNFILFIIFLLIAIPVGFALFSFFYKEPTCFDGKKNGIEEGVDCGGECERICERVSRDLNILWERYFPISQNTYNVIAMVENPNPDAGLQAVSYRFRLFDRKNILLTEREGVMRVPPNSIVPVIESGLSTGELVPRRVSFSFTSDFEWIKESAKEQVLVVRDQKLLNESTEPRINAIMTNISTRPVTDVDIVAIVYDAQGNAIGSSSTYIERVEKDNFVNLVFTWSDPFDETISKIEIIPLYESSR